MTKDKSWCCRLFSLLWDSVFCCRRCWMRCFLYKCCCSPCRPHCRCHHLSGCLSYPYLSGCPDCLRCRPVRRSGCFPQSLCCRPVPPVPFPDRPPQALRGGTGVATGTLGVGVAVTSGVEGTAFPYPLSPISPPTIGLLPAIPKGLNEWVLNTMVVPSTLGIMVSVAPFSRICSTE